MQDCIFCKIGRGEIKVQTLFEDDDVIAFPDINPQAPVHILAIPKIHIATLNDLEQPHAEIVGKLFLTAKTIAQQQGFAQQGYRTVINCNADAGQTVFHLHLHIMAGRIMGWPPFPDNS